MIRFIIRSFMLYQLFCNSYLPRRAVFNNESVHVGSDKPKSKESGDFASEVKDRAKVAIANAEAKIGSLADNKDPKVAEEVKDLTETVKALQAFIDFFKEERAEAMAGTFKRVIELLQNSGNNDLIRDIQNINNVLLAKKDIQEMMKSKSDELLLLNNEYALVWNARKKKMMVVHYTLENKNGQSIPQLDSQSEYANNSLDGIQVEEVVHLAGTEQGLYSSLVQETVNWDDSLAHEGNENADEKEAINSIRDAFKRFMSAAALNNALNTGAINAQFIGKKLAVFFSRLNLGSLTNTRMNINLPEMKGKERNDENGLVDVTFVPILHFDNGNTFVEVMKNKGGEPVKVAVNTEDKADKPKAA